MVASPVTPKGSRGIAKMSRESVSHPRPCAFSDHNACMVIHLPSVRYAPWSGCCRLEKLKPVPILIREVTNETALVGTSCDRYRWAPKRHALLAQTLVLVVNVSNEQRNMSETCLSRYWLPAPGAAHVLDELEHHPAACLLIREPKQGNLENRAGHSNQFPRVRIVLSLTPKQLKAEVAHVPRRGSVCI